MARREKGMSSVTGAPGTVLSIWTHASCRTDDLQASAPEVRLGLSRAGVRGVSKAIRLSYGGSEKLVAADIECAVDLDPAQKGVHMSRFPELFEEAIEEVVIGEALLVEQLAEHIAAHIVSRQEALRAEVKIVARYPLERETPVSKLADPGPLLDHRDRRRLGARRPPRRRRRADGLQRVPVRAGTRPQPGRRSGCSRPASAATRSSGSSSSCRWPRTTSAGSARCSSARSSSSTPRSSSGSSSAR